MFNRPLKTHVQKMLEIGRKRKKLTEEEANRLARLNAGYKGELHVHQRLTDELSSQPISLYNLQMNINGSTCQIDCLLIFQHEIILLEVKNYQGDFIIEEDKWYTFSKQEIRNPLHQLKRTELLVHQLVTTQKLPVSVQSFIIFTHPSFFIYQAPPDIPAIFPNQFSRAIQKLRNIPCFISDRHVDFANFLKAQHQSSSAFETTPSMDYGSLTKGIFCKDCDEHMLEYNDKHMRCGNCGTIEALSQGIMRAIRELQTLFPEKKIKINTIADWINHCVSPYKIRKAIRESSTLIRKGRESHYVFPK